MTWTPGGLSRNIVILNAIGLAFGVCICAGQTSYQFVSLTDDHRFATAKTMNQSGVAIGMVDADSKPVILDPRLGTIYPPYAELLNGINASGDVIGRTFEGQWFVSTPPYTDYIGVGNAVDPPAVYSVDAINDRGDMAGTPVSNGQWFPGLNILGAMAINNAGQVLAYGYVAPPLIGYFLFTPGKGDIPVPRFPTALNNSGDVLFGSPFGPPVAPQYIQTAFGQITLPSGYQWTGFNDNDEAVGYSAMTSSLNVTSITPVLYSVATGLIDLSTRFQNTHALVGVVPVTINNAGEILVNFTWTSFPGQPVPPAAGIGLLVPLSGTSGPASSVSAPMRRARNYTMNGVRIVLPGAVR